MASQEHRYTGEVVIFSGPHGVGKDTLEARFRQEQPCVARVVRHITRSAAPLEVDGQDYHFVTAKLFKRMIANDELLEYAEYPDCLSGTSKIALATALESADIATVTINFEDALPLHQKLGAIGVRSTCLFISPVSYDTLREGEYLTALATRMQNRNRPADRVANKLTKAKVYRELYLANESEVTYIENSNGHFDDALYDIVKATAAM